MRKFEAIDQKFMSFDQKFATFDQKFDGKIATLNQKIDHLAIWLISTLLGLGAAILGRWRRVSTGCEPARGARLIEESGSAVGLVPCPGEGVPG